MKFVRERLPCGGKNDSRRLAVGRQMRHIRVYPDQNRPMAIARSRTFRSGNSEAVRLPKAVAFPPGVVEVEIIAIGNTRVVSPVGHRWDDYFATKVDVSEDFMLERDQGDWGDEPNHFED